MALFIYRHTLLIKKCVSNTDTLLSPYNGTGKLEAFCVPFFKKKFKFF